MSGWVPKHRFGTAIYDFAPNGDFQVALQVGDRVEVFEESSGWCKGIVMKQPPLKGIFPSSFVNLAEENVPPPPPPAAAQPVTVGSDQDLPFYKQKLARLKNQTGPATGATTAASAANELPAFQASNAAGAAATEQKKPAFRFTTATTDSQPAAGAALAAPAQNGTQPSPRGAASTPTATASVTSPRKPPPPAGARPSAQLGQPPLQAQPAQPAAAAPAAAAPALTDGSTEHGHAPISHSISFEALYGEISDCILEWTAALELHLHGGNTPEYHRVKERISALLGYRSKVMRETDPKRREALRDEIIQLIEGSRKMQEGYMVPRNKEGEMADTTNTGVVDLLSAHRQMYNVMKEESSGVWHAAASRRRVESVTAQGLEEKVPDRRSPFPPGVMQLYLNVKMCIFAVGESTELFFSLYNEAQKRFITEDFYVALTEAGMPEKISLLNKLTTLFKDLDSDDFEGNLWLVCFIYRKGRLIHDPTKKKEPGMNYRRPFGCSVLNLADLKLETSFGKEHSPSPVQIYTPQQEDRFPIMHQLLIAKDMTGLTPPPKSVGIVMSLTLYHGEEAVVRENNKPKLPESDVPVTNKLDFPEAMKAADVRNDLYIFLLGGKFNQDNKTAAKNIEVIMRVCNSRGDTIPDCLIRGSGGAAVATSEYHSSVFYHLNEPVLNETVQLRIPPDMLEQCHLYFSFWHVSTTAKKNSTPFAFGYQRLTTESGAVISDEDHVVITYTPVKDEGKNDGYYLKGDAAVPKLQQRKGEQFVIRSKLVSTKKTQNDTLTLLQKWRTLDINTLKLTLSKFLQMERGTGLNDYARFVRETFDALFGMLVSHHHSALHEVVFQAVFHLIALLTDRKASKFRSMVDQYISTIFAQPMVHHLLIKLTKKRLDEAKAKMDQSSMNFTKCFGYVIKLIVFSRVLDMQSPRPSCDDKQFKANLLEMFTSANALVSIEEYKDARYLLPSQTYLIRGFPELVDDLSKVFNAAELGTVSRDLIAAIPNIENHTLNKLNLVRLLLNSDTGALREYRTVLFPIVKQTLRVYLRSIDSGSTNEPYLCLAILQRLMTLQQSKKHAGEQDVWDYSDLLLDVLHVALTIQESHLGQRQLRPPSETVIQYCKVDLLQDSVTLLWSLVVAFGPQLMEKFVQSLSVEQLKEFSTKLLVLSLNCLTLKLYPEMWIVMNFLQLDLIAKNLRVLSDHLRTKLGPSSSDFTPEIWRRYFEVSLALLTIDALKVEKFSDSKKQFVLQRYGDIRMTVMDEVRKMWAFLGNRQTAFIGPLVPALFDLAQNSVNADAKALAVDMYYDMVSTEFRVTKEFSEVERYTIDSLYNIANISQDAGDRFMEFLLNVMTDRLAKDPVLSASGTSFLTHVHKMYTLMSSLLKFPDTAIYEDERTSVALRLMNYLEESAHVRKEMASRYVQYLVDLHVGLGNFVEAGMAQLYQIKLLGFTDNMLEAAGAAPVEAERQRKEHYFKAAISSFVQGDAYERAIALSAQLRDYYQYECYDFNALAQTLRDEASLFESIVSKDRVYANYFRVVYHGRGFDDEIRDKEFVYRGCQLEAIIDFSNRIKKKFPNARIISSADAPSAEMLEQSPQVISLATLKPEKEESEKFLSTPEWQAKMMLKLAETKTNKPNTRTPPRNVLVNRQNNDLIVFSLVKPIQKAKEKNPQNEFKHLWVQKTYLVAEESFPTNRRRVQIVSKWEILISPIETAVREVVKKNEELKEKTDLASANIQQLGPLSMLLQGMIDAAVNGGTQKYISAFLDAEFLQENPEPQNARLQQELKEALRQQFELLKSSMLIFNRLKNDTLQGLFDHLNNLLTKIIAQTKQVIS